MPSKAEASFPQRYTNIRRLFDFLYAPLIDCRKKRSRRSSLLPISLGSALTY